jgi:hypothetical protein
MFKVKIDMVGFDSFSDLMMGIPFENGISARVVTPDEADRLGASVRLVKVDSDEQVGAGTVMAKARLDKVEAPVAVPAPKAPEEPVVPVTEVKYTRESLEELAESGGIKAVRKVADEFGVKGVQITALIDGILLAQVEED